jgi:hypothetical protein
MRWRSAVVLAVIAGDQFGGLSGLAEALPNHIAARDDRIVYIQRVVIARDYGLGGNAAGVADCIDSDFDSVASAAQCGCVERPLALCKFRQRLRRSVVIAPAVAQVAVEDFGADSDCGHLSLSVGVHESYHCYAVTRYRLSDS